jgi:uncharacterized protein
VADLRIRLSPRAARDEVGPARDGVLLVRVTAPPVDGKANTSLRRLLAKRLGVPVTTISITRGHSSRDKLVQVAGLADADVRARLGLG